MHLHLYSFCLFIFAASIQFDDVFASVSSSRVLQRCMCGAYLMLSALRALTEDPEKELRREGGSP